MILALLLLPALVLLYLSSNLLLVAWIRRRAKGWLRATKLFMLLQIRPLSAARIRLTSLAHLVSIVVLAIELRERLEIIEVALLLIGYIFVVAALTLSLLAQMPVFKRMASDAFVRPILLGVPLVFGYLSRGYSAVWLDETLPFGSANAPMAHFAGTFMMAGIGAAMVVLVIGLSFEFAMIFMPSLPTSNAKKRRTQPAGSKPSPISMVKALFSEKLDERSAEHREWRAATRTLRLIVLFSFSFMGCMMVVQAALSPFRSGFGKIVLATIAFELDAAPADRCALTKEEKEATQGKQPRLKALMLATSQEKAILLTRGPHLFDQVMLKELANETGRTLTIGRSVTCFEPSASAPESK